MRGFSLVELSIVLVILGLLTGGILAGQSLIHASELRSYMADYSRYIAALHSFRGKYFGMPGDITNATKFWGAADPTPATCKTTTPTGTQTCDGDGNGAVRESATSFENFQAWRQMANAGLVEGSFTGLAGTCGAPGDRCPTPGTNIPITKLNKGGWGLYYVASLSADTGSRYAGRYGNVFYSGKASNDYADNPFLKTEDAWNIDTKLDDGKPGYGKIKSYTATSRPNCASTDVASSAIYDLTQTRSNCTLLIETGL
jgi:prepilin-type N-terminal cleavage/methylation domain-containing protein